MSLRTTQAILGGFINKLAQRQFASFFQIGTGLRHGSANSMVVAVDIVSGRSIMPVPGNGHFPELEPAISLMLLIQSGQLTPIRYGGSGGRHCGYYPVGIIYQSVLFVIKLSDAALIAG